MKIGNNYSPNFGLKIKSNKQLECVIREWQVGNKWSPEKIKKKLDEIKKMAPDTYTLEFQDGSAVTPNFKITSLDKDVALPNYSAESEYGTGWFLMRTIKKACNHIVKTNNRAGKTSELMNYAEQ